jgi:hypothetical protein
MKEIQGLSESINRLSSYPTVSWLRLGEGLTASKGAEQELIETVARLGGLSDADALKAEKYPGGVAKYREKEAKKFLLALGKEADYRLFYGQKSAKSIEGIFRMLGSSADTYVSCGASSETFSIYGIKFGDDGVYGFYSPFADGKIFSITVYPRTLKTVTQGGVSKQLPVYQTEFESLIGLAIADMRALGRITKIDSSNRLTYAKIIELYDAMGQKPDVWVTNFSGYGEFVQWPESMTRMRPEDTGLNFEVQSLDGIPIIVDSNLVSNEGSL